MKKVIKIPKDVELPLIGLIQVGIIDRGTNLLQVRPTTICNLNCTFCSTDSGMKSRMRVTEYIVSLDYLVDWFKEIVKFKGSHDIEGFIDSTGEPVTYPKLVELVQELSDIRGVETVALETNGVLLTEEKIDELSEAGLSRINLSLHALNPEISRELSGCEWYDVERIKDITRYIAQSRVELLLTPVWIPRVNDEEIPRLIEFTRKINQNKRWPCLGIQKYEAHRYGRKPRGIKEISWWKFFRQLELWEKQFGIKLKLNSKDFGVHKRKMLPYVFRKGEKITVEVKAPGWMKNGMIGVAEDRCVTIINCKAIIGNKIRVRILRNKHNLYVAKVC